MLKIEDGYLRINKQYFNIEDIKLIAIKHGKDCLNLVCVENNIEVIIGKTKSLRMAKLALRQINHKLHKYGYLNFAMLQRESVNMDKVDSVYYEYDESLDRYYVGVDFGEKVSYFYRKDYVDTKATIDRYNLQKQQYKDSGLTK